NGRPARPQRAKRRGVRFGTLSPLSDARTKLADFFSILLSIHIFARKRQGVVQSVGKHDLVEPWVPIAKIDDASIEKHPPHSDERRIEHRLNFFGMRLESLAPLFNRFCIVQAKVFDVRRNEPGFSHGTNDLVERWNISTGEDIFQRPWISWH